MNSLALEVPAHAPPDPPAPGGRITLDHGPARGVLLAPTTIDAARPYPLVIVLHGAGRQDELIARGLEGAAYCWHALFFVPRSVRHTWDLIAGGDGEDRDFLAWALGWIGARFAVDPARCALLGYSDGASYALALGLSNPRLFAAVMAWAPGFLAIDTHNLRPDDPKPRIYLEHGTHGPMFPFDQIAVPLRDVLVRMGYPLEFRADEGGVHWPRRELQGEAIDWFLGGV